jgi:hypothetical protein
MQFDQLGVEGRPLNGEHVLMLGSPQLSVDLLSADLHLPLLLVGLLLVREEIHTWLWRSSLHHNHRDGLELPRCTLGG